MITDIKGLHHVTSMAADANENNTFFTDTLGLRRVKKTVNFDAPDVYHLYYGDETGTPGSVMTYFPFPGMRRGHRGAGEVGVTEFAVPKGSLGYWQTRLVDKGMIRQSEDVAFGEKRLSFDGPDGDGFAVVETEDRGRTPWTGVDVPETAGVFGFNGARFRLKDASATGELLEYMGYQKADTQGNLTRYIIEGGNAADTIDLEQIGDAPMAGQGAGSVHHIAFAVDDREAQLRVRQALMDTGYQVTPVIDRNYFWAIYFRTPGGVLFEVATNEPGFDHDEDTAHLGEALKLPEQYEAQRAEIERVLPELAA
ncbi:MAG: ring-cleaving dioxygenase [Pseudomonadota bacterium]